MSSYTVTLLLLNDRSMLTVTVKASSAVKACTVAQTQNPGTVAAGADLVHS